MGTSSTADMIVVASHRGGSLKTTLSAMLALALARREVDVLLADLAMAGGAFSLDSPELTTARALQGMALPDARLRGHRRLSLRMLHAPRGLADPAGFGEIRGRLLSPKPDLVIVDTPACGREELAGLLKMATLLLITLPSNALALRSLAPFLQTVSEIRSLPGRSFEVAVVPTGTGGRSSEAAALDRYVNRYLGPIMCGASIPIDDSIAATVSAGKLPEVAEDNSMSGSNLTLLTAAVLERLKRAGAGIVA